MPELKFKLIVKESKDKIEETLSECEAFFKKRYKYKFDTLQELSQDFAYKEELFQTVLYIQCNENNVSDFCAELLRQWCSWPNRKRTTEKKLILHAWLIPVIREFLKSKKPFHQIVETKEFAFGTLPEMCTYIPHYNYENEDEIRCSFYHNKKTFSIFLAINHHKKCRREQLYQKFIINYDSIAQVLINDQNKETNVDIFFNLLTFPFVFVERISSANSRHDDLSNKSSVSEQVCQEKRWERSLNFGCECTKSFSHIKRVGKTLVLKIALTSKYKAQHILERLMQRCSPDVDFCYANISKISLQKLNPANDDYSPTFSMTQITDENILFNLQYAWQLLSSNSLHIIDQIRLESFKNENSVFTINYWEFFKTDILNFAKSNAQALTDALFHISELVNRKIIFTFSNALKVLFNYYVKFEKKNDLPLGMCLIRRVVITPSKIIYFPPTEFFDNRIIRDNPNRTDYMLRVSIEDDNFSKLTFAVQYHSQREKFLEKVISNVLLNGYQIGNRCYQVLASSSSQLREHGLWLYAKDSDGKTAADIRMWMGDFSNITNVAKYMARMGQCFSTSEEALQIIVHEKNSFEIDDVKTSDGKYNFSDGIGMISRQLVAEIQEAKQKLEHESNQLLKYEPSAFQIRYKGCKGMLCLNPDLKGRLLVYRPSMEKFKCDTINTLEIVKISAPRPLYLNRPLITILEQLGVKSAVFMELQRNMLLDLTDSLLYEEKAAHLLANHVTVDIPFVNLQESGLCLTEEPFFRSLLIAVYKNAVDKLKVKARIAVPPQFGRNMLGVLDETGILKYGEVFVQYSEETGCNVSKTKILHDSQISKLTVGII